MDAKHLTRSDAVQSLDSLGQFGRDIIQQEAEALLMLAENLDHHFAEACHLLLACKGRIIVTGIGKSGHIGRKIAATFASTGNPAFFVHPAEAKHGDAGMITAEDTLIALSYSGESEEIIALIPLLKKLNLPFIAITGNPNSTLAKAAFTHLNVNIKNEACPLNLAPTSSTTATLAIGDALAMTISQQQQFTAEQFALSHPGGVLGRRLLLKVNHIMHTGNAIPSVDIEANLVDAIMEMTQKKLGMTVILDKNKKLAGIFTDGDLRRILNKNLNFHQEKINQVMNTKPKIAIPEMAVTDALNVMNALKITSLVVVDDHNHPLGIAHMHDILRLGIL